jgi:hypothetical protein
MKYASLVYYILATSTLIASEQSTPTIHVGNLLEKRINAKIKEFNEYGRYLGSSKQSISSCNRLQVPSTIKNNTNQSIICFDDLPTSPSTVNIYIDGDNNTKIQYGDCINLERTQLNKRYIDIIKVSSTSKTRELLLCLPRQGTSLRLGEKNNSDTIASKTVTLINKDLPYVVITSIALRKPLTYEVANHFLNQRKTCAIKGSKLVHTATTTLLQGQQESITTASSSTNKDIIDSLLKFVIPGALQKLTIYSSAINSGDTLTLELLRTDIIVTNQNNDAIATLYTGQSEIDILS